MLLSLFSRKALWFFFLFKQEVTMPVDHQNKSSLIREIMSKMPSYILSKPLEDTFKKMEINDLLDLKKFVNTSIFSKILELAINSEILKKCLSDPLFLKQASIGGSSEEVLKNTWLIQLKEKEPDHHKALSALLNLTYQSPTPFDKLKKPSPF